MLPNKHYYSLTQIAFLLAISVSAVPAYAISIPSAQDMINTISTQLPAVMRMLTAIAYVMGMYFILMGIFKLKQYGEQRTMMSSEHSLAGPLIMLVVGTLLLYIPTSVEVGMSTFWADPNPYQYKDNESAYGDYMKNIYSIIQIVGVLAFIRGLVILSHLSKHGQPGTFGKGLTHIIGGIFCINIYQAVQVILSTLGIQT